jgi:hypothetical protein
MSSARRKPEDSAQGCRDLERDSRERAAVMASDHMRAVLERSAKASSARPKLLDRIARDFNTRAAANRLGRGIDG